MAIGVQQEKRITVRKTLQKRRKKKKKEYSKETHQTILIYQKQICLFFCLFKQVMSYDWKTDKHSN